MKDNNCGFYALDLNKKNQGNSSLEYRANFLISVRLRVFTFSPDQHETNYPLCGQAAMCSSDKRDTASK